METVKALEAVQKQKAVTETELKAKSDSEASLKVKIDDLTQQLQSKRDAQAQQQSIAARIGNIVTPKVSAQSSVVAGCGDNAYANFIYMHESGCSLWDPNPVSGACGLGQAWPCSKLLAVCPNLDYVCENAFFTTYANAKGGWQASYNLWISQSWW